MYVKRIKYTSADASKINEFLRHFTNEEHLTDAEDCLYAECLMKMRTDAINIERHFIRNNDDFTFLEVAPSAELLKNYYVSCLGEELYEKIQKIQIERADEFDLKVTITEETI